METPNTTKPWWVTALWAAHGLLRIALFGYLMVYGWSKITLMQMGRLDYSSAIKAFGEKSPMGLLWDFVAYSPAFQILSGAVEVIAGILLIWRRTTWLGGLVGAMAMGFVFLLNALYDVPVKQLALALTIGCVIVVIPELPRLWRFVQGKATGESILPHPIPWPRVHAVTRWIIAPLGLLIALGPVVLVFTVPPQESDSALPGVYRVVADTAPPAEQLAEDERWQEIAFGQYEANYGSLLTIRYANGELREGWYRHTEERAIEVNLFPVLKGDQGLIRDVEETHTFEWEIEDDGQISITGSGQDLQIEEDPELRYLFDREFSWTPSTPINR